MKALGFPGLAGPGQGPRCGGSRSGQRPMFLTLPADHTHTRDSMVAVSPEGVERSSESAVLSCSGDGWDSGSKERRRETGFHC